MMRSALTQVLALLAILLAGCHGILMNDRMIFRRKADDAEIEWQAFEPERNFNKKEACLPPGLAVLSPDYHNGQDDM